MDLELKGYITKCSVWVRIGTRKLDGRFVLEVRLEAEPRVRLKWS